MNDARFWKHELFRESSRFAEAIKDEEQGGGLVRMVERRSPFLERFAFVTAYMMRKLAESEWLTQDVLQRGWAVTEFPCTLPPPHRRWFAVLEDRRSWRPPFERHYDLNAGAARTLSFRQVCNALIHHFAFDARLAPESGAPEMLFINDERATEALYGMRLDTYRELVLDVAYDEVRWVDMDASRTKRPVIQRRHRPRDA